MPFTAHDHTIVQCRCKDWSTSIHLFKAVWSETSGNHADVKIFVEGTKKPQNKFWKFLRGEESRDNPLSSMPAKRHCKVGNSRIFFPEARVVIKDKGFYQ